MSDQQEHRADADAWVPCEQGELGRMLARARTVRLNRSLTRGIVAGAVCIALLGGWVIVSRRSQNDRPGASVAAISCPEVHAQIKQYIAGSLDADTMAQIHDHLLHCPKCSEEYTQLTGKPVAMLPAGCTDPTCPHCHDHHEPPLRALLADRNQLTTVALVME